MNLDKDISQRIELMRFPLIVGVVFIHSFPVLVNVGEKIGLTDPSRSNVIVRTLFSEVFARISVPMLFTIAAFLFFQGLDQGAKSPISLKYFMGKWKSRLRTLLLPFLFWNAVAILFMFTIQHSPFGYLFGDTAKISGFRTFDTINAMLGITHAPIAYQFWFIRNLIVLMILSPLFYWLIKGLPHVWLLIIGACWLLQMWVLRVPDAAGMFFFSLGAYFALWPVNLRGLDHRLWTLGGVYSALAVLDLSFKGQWFSGRLHNLTNLLGVLFVFALTAKIAQMPKARDWLLKLAPASFFVFAVHEPLLTLLRKSLYVLLRPSSEALVLSLYFLNPILIIVLCTLAYRVIYSKFPRFTGFITGGR